eukprot:6025406-Pyramimonas_sp.AAC.1
MLVLPVIDAPRLPGPTPTGIGPAGAIKTAKCSSNLILSYQKQWLTTMLTHASEVVGLSQQYGHRFLRPALARDGQVVSLKLVFPGSVGTPLRAHCMCLETPQEDLTPMMSDFGELVSQCVRFPLSRPYRSARF